MDDDKYITIYTQFRRQLQQNTPIQQPLPYDWLNLPKTIPGEWMVYYEMVEDYAREIANVINQFLSGIEKLCAWDKVMLNYKEEEIFYIIHEFIEPLCNMCLNLPYVIRSRFIFSVTHLSYQANRTLLGRDWKDDLPSDDQIYFSIMDKYAANWHSYKRLKQALERLSDKEYQNAVSDYRNQYHHRFPSHIGFGLSKIMTRKVINTGTVAYAWGYSKPLELKDIILKLSEQNEIAVECFRWYQNIVREQMEKIATYKEPNSKEGGNNATI